MNVFMRVLLLSLATFAVSSCSSYGVSGNKSAYNSDQLNSGANGTATTLAAGAPLGGSLTDAMDANDKDKLSKALDAALGKSSSWKNPVKDIAYTVTPIQKAKVPGEKICRLYTVQASNNGRTEEVRGTACITDKGAWQVAG